MNNAHFVDLFLEWHTELESPLDFQVATALFTISGAVERKVWFDRGVGLLYPNVYLILVGQPATRKSVIMFGDRILSNCNVNRFPDKMTVQSMWDVMEEGHKIFEIGESMHKHCSWSLNSEEWQFFIGDQDKEFLNSLNKFYDCRDKFDYTTKWSGKNHLENIYLTMIGAIQPEILAHTLPHEAIGSGFTSRLIYVVSDKERMKRAIPIMNPKIEAALVKQAQLINMAAGPMKFDTETQRIMIDWYETGEYEKSPLRTDPNFATYIARMPTHTLKLAMLMSLGRSAAKGRIDYTIRKTDWNRALKWLKQIEKTMTRAYGTYGRNPLAFAIVSISNFVEKHKTCSYTDLYNALWQNISGQDMNRALEMLIEMKKVSIKMTPQGKEVKWIGKQVR